jgi:hypothetical protein
MGLVNKKIMPPFTFDARSGKTRGSEDWEDRTDSSD